MEVSQPQKKLSHIDSVMATSREHRKGRAALRGVYKGLRLWRRLDFFSLLTGSKQAVTKIDREDG